MGRRYRRILDIIPPLAGLFVLRGLLLLLILAVSASAQVPVGATKQEMIDLIGWPTSASKARDREILNYPDFTVVMEQGRMTSLQFKSPKHKPPASYLIQPQKMAATASTQNRAPTPEEIVGPNSSRQDPRPTPSTIPAVTTELDRPPNPFNPPPDPFAQVKSRIYWMVGLFAGLAILKVWAEKAKRRRRREVDDIFPPPPRKPNGGEPPLVISSRETSPLTKPDPIKGGWSLALLKELEWYRFEQVVAAYERELGNDAELTDFGPDGGIDIKVFEKESRTPKRVIQCKAFDRQLVGVELVRAFYGAMTLEKAPQGAFYTTSGFTETALAVGKTEPNLELVDGPTFLNRIARLQLPAQLKLFEIATEGDYTTPTCSTCGIKMVVRTAAKGRNEGDDFYGCRNFPRCQQTLKIRRSG